MDSILFSDQCSFTLSGNVNRQNFRIWGKENSDIILQKPAFSSKILIGAYFFENEKGLPDTINVVRYLELIKNKLLPELK